MNDLLTWLQNYYLLQCDGEWEHAYLFKIDTLDNPGWSCEFDLAYTDVENAPFEILKADRTEHDWVFCKVEDRKFKGYGGPQNLIEILTVFRKWVEANPVADA